MISYYPIPFKWLYMQSKQWNILSFIYLFFYLYIFGSHKRLQIAIRNCRNFLPLSAQFGFGLVLLYERGSVRVNSERRTDFEKATSRNWSEVEQQAAVEVKIDSDISVLKIRQALAANSGRRNCISQLLRSRLTCLTQRSGSRKQVKYESFTEGVCKRNIKLAPH